MPEPPLPPEDVQSYPRPPLCERVPQTVRVLARGALLLETRAAWRICETHHPPTYYLPRDAFPPGSLAPARGASFCEWKGQAGYLDLRSGDELWPAAAWTYPRPAAPYAAIAGHVALYLRPGLAAFVGGVEASPQPGGFYGGWVTPNLSGRIKGAPGTLHW